MHCCEMNLVRIFSYYDKIRFIACCFRQDEVLAELTYDEYRAIPDIVEYCQKIHEVQPKNHKFEITHPSCKAVESKCDWTPDTINRIDVCISNACNLDCTMCGIPHGFNKIKDELYWETLYKIKGHHLEVIYLTTQGEPFLNKKKVFKYLEGLDYNEDCHKINFITNATLLTIEDIEWLRAWEDRTGIKVDIGVSCDAIEEETYKKIRKNDKFETVIENICKLYRLGLTYCIHYTAMPENLHELPNVKKWWAEKCPGLQVHVNPVYDTPVNRGAYEILSNSKEWKDFLKNQSCW